MLNCNLLLLIYSTIYFNDKDSICTGSLLKNTSYFKIFLDIESIRIILFVRWEISNVSLEKFDFITLFYLVVEKKVDKSFFFFFTLSNGLKRRSKYWKKKCCKAICSIHSLNSLFLLQRKTPFPFVKSSTIVFQTFS